MAPATMIELHCGDCTQILRQLDTRGIDAVVTDPPYGIGYTYHGGGRGGRGLHRTQRCSPTIWHPTHRRPIAGDDQPFDPAPWLAWPCVLWGSHHYAARLPSGSWLAWDKSGGGRGPKDNHVDCDFGWCSIPGIKRNVFSYLWKGIACAKAGESNGRRWHPTQKPVALMRWCISMLNLKPGSTILDPYMGVGATGIAAAELGHSFIGCELDPEYFVIAQKRIQAAWNAAASSSS